MAGARPVFADVDPVRLTIDPAAIDAAIGPRTRGDPAGAPVRPGGRHGRGLERMASRAQPARSSRTAARRIWQRPAAGPVGTIGVAGAFSFYPTKNLGALGDGGAVVTNDAALAERVEAAAQRRADGPDDHREAGVNSRLDELQAAILSARLACCAAGPSAGASSRRATAPRWPAAASASPRVRRRARVSLVRRTNGERAALRAHLEAEGIDTLVHYPMPIPNSRDGAFAPANARWRHASCREIVFAALHPRMLDAR